MSKFEFYQDKKRKWRWRLVSINGRIIADSGQGYARRRNVLRAIETVISAIGHVRRGPFPIREVEK